MHQDKDLNVLTFCQEFRDFLGRSYWKHIKLLCHSKGLYKC